MSLSPKIAVCCIVDIVLVVKQAAVSKIKGKYLQSFRKVNKKLTKSNNFSLKKFTKFFATNQI